MFSDTDTILRIKEEINASEGIPIEKQHLYLRLTGLGERSEFEDTETIKNVVKTASTIYLYVKL